MFLLASRDHHKLMQPHPVSSEPEDLPWHYKHPAVRPAPPQKAAALSSCRYLYLSPGCLHGFLSGCHHHQNFQSHGFLSCHLCLC